jgi:hypothetical protein
MLKWTLFDRDAGYTFTGIETRPKEIVPEDVARAGMNDLYGGRARNGVCGDRKTTILT